MNMVRKRSCETSQNEALADYNCLDVPLQEYDQAQDKIRKTLTEFSLVIWQRAELAMKVLRHESPSKLECCIQIPLY